MIKKLILPFIIFFLFPQHVARSSCSTAGMASEMLTNTKLAYPAVSSTVTDIGSFTGGTGGYTAMSQAICDNISTSGGTGTVTSVGLSLPLFSIANSPVTTSGTLTGSLLNTSPNYVFAGPSAAPSGAPSFRPLVAADIPALNYTPTTSGTSILKGNGSGGTSSALSSDVISLFTSCSGTQYLGADGACHNSGSGSVTSVTASLPVASSGGTTPNITLASPVPISLGGTGQTSLTSGGTGGSASPAIASGTYNPTNEANSGISGISFGTWSWLRVGNVVTVGGNVTVAVGAQAGYSEINLPTTTANFTNSSQASGTLVSNNGITGLVGQIYPVTGAQYVYLQFLSTATSATWFAHFIYQVQ